MSGVQPRVTVQSPSLPRSDHGATTAAGHRPVALAASVRSWSNRGNDRKRWLASRVSSYVNFYQFLRLSSSRLLNLNSHHHHHHHHHPVIPQVSSVQQWHLNLHKLTVKVYVHCPIISFWLFTRWLYFFRFRWIIWKIFFPSLCISIFDKSVGIDAGTAENGTEPATSWSRSHDTTTPHTKRDCRTITVNQSINQSINQKLHR